jgi:hypothetical protein
MLRVFAAATKQAMRGAELGVRSGTFMRLGRSPPRCRAGMPVFALRSFASTPVLTPVPEPSGDSSHKDGGREDLWATQKRVWLAPTVVIGIAAVVASVLHNQKLAEEQAAHERKLAEEPAANERKLAEELAAEQAYEKSHRKQLDVALRKLSTTFTAVALDGGYIPRTDAENSIHHYIGSAPPSNYLVVTAPEGCGKTTVIHHALAGRAGVVVVKVEAKSDVPDIAQLLVMALGVYDGKVVDGGAEEFVVEVCNRFASEHDGLKPVFVLKIEGDGQDAESTASLANQLGHLQKALSSDLRVAHTIADISAIAVAAGMGNDPRAEFVNICGLTTDEAVLRLEPFAHRLQEKDVLVKKVVEQIGGNPASLRAVGGNLDPRGVIAKMLARAEAEVKSYARAHPAHKEALRQLLLKPFDEGMLVYEFEDIVRAETKRLNLSAVAATAQSASQSSRVIHKNLQNAHIVIHNFPQYRVGQRLAAAWEEEAKRWW